MSRPPIATYRLQLHGGVGFAEAAELADHLAAIGVSHLYLSPIAQARRGSEHGYDVVDPRRIDASLGGEDGLERLAKALHERGLGLVVDLVPNHVAADAENPLWWDVLEKGERSAYARCFDVDWSRGKIVLAILPEPYEALLAAGEIRVERRDGRPCLRVPGHVLPLADPPGGVAPRADELDRDALDRWIASQAYRLAYWKDGLRELNVRRFFDVADLVGLRVEDSEVFELAHGLALDLVRRGTVDGLRVDHVDGLRDPGAYLGRLRERAGDAPIWVEKILHAGEELPESWPVEGTTGYELLRLLDGLFLDPEGARALSSFHAEFTGEERDFATVAREAKLHALDELLPAEVDRLARELVALGARHSRAVEPGEARLCLRELLASFPVYRTYVRRGEPPRAEDRRRIEEATREARSSAPERDAGILDLLCDLLLLRWDGDAESDFCARFQQLGPAVAAKGVEDTALYRYHRLVALNEVGGDPDSPGVDPDAFHRAMERAAARAPLSLAAASTHDTKRAEDVRARLLALSEMPRHWERAVRRWTTSGAARRTPVPDRRAEYLLYQTLVGAWPIDAARANAYLRKAAREAKLRTSWLDPDEGYEAELAASVEGLLADSGFRADLEASTAPIVELGRVTSLAQLAIRLTVPGVPDLYQGTELWSLRLVDPDNRAPVDFGRRRRLSSAVAMLSAEEALADMDEGLPRLWLAQRVLALRRARPECFGPAGGYAPLTSAGVHRSRVVGFLRGGRVAAIVPRLAHGRCGAWGDTRVELPRGRWRDELGGGELEGGTVPVGRLLARFPVAVLARRD